MRRESKGQQTYFSCSFTEMSHVQIAIPLILEKIIKILGIKLIEGSSGTVFRNIMVVGTFTLEHMKKMGDMRIAYVLLGTKCCVYYNFLE